MSKDYVSLHNHTTFSIMQSLIKPVDLFKRVKELGQSAIAVTDSGSLAGAWDCMLYAKEAGVKLIIGCEFYFADDLSNESARLRHIILLAKNAEGYKNLLKLNKLGNDNAVIMFGKVIPRIDWNAIENHSDDLICTTACGAGILSQLINTRKLDQAKLQARRLKDIFGTNLALEIQPHGMKRVANAYRDYEDQKFTNAQLIKIGQELDIKVVATTDAHYLTPDQHKAHDVLLAVGSGQPITSGNRLKYDSGSFHVKSRDEVLEFFSMYPQAEEFCDNSLFFANMCEEPAWIDPKYSNPTGRELPDFKVKEQLDYKEFLTWLEMPINEIEKNYLLKLIFPKEKIDEDRAYLRYWTWKNFYKNVPEGKEQEYADRLYEEISVIEYQGYSSYMMIVADYLEYGRNAGYLIGYGRGSAGGSLIAYLTNIHYADPIKYGLIFARFQNKFKMSTPDIDSDIESAGKEYIEKYIRNKYGEDHVAGVSNINTMTPKVYARDIARAFQYGGDAKAAVAIGNALADAIPKDIKTVDEALKSAPLFMEYANSEKYKDLKLYAHDLGSKAKAWSTHAGGTVIGKRPLTDLVPLRRDKEKCVVLEYEKERAEANGLVKMDILGLSTLDIIKETHKIIVEVGKQLPKNPPDFDKYDEKTYNLIHKGNTLCVFQLGTSAGTIDLCRRLKPKSIEDLAVVTTLARPAAKEIRNPFIEAKDSGKKVDLLHQSLERAFSSTFGFPIYEECLMYIGQDVAGWDMNQADRLRKLTKDKGKNPEKVAKWREEFINDAITNKNIEKDIATKIWDAIIARMGSYTFNKSHAVFYSFLSFQTAQLKAHYPLEFLTANLMHQSKSNAVGSKDEILKIKTEIRALKVKIIPPDVNKSESTYKIISDNLLMTGFDSLKGVGKKAIPEIIEKRPFSSFEDFITRVDASKVNSKTVQILAASGCLDSFGMTRRQMFLYGADFKKKYQAWQKRKRKVGEFEYAWPEKLDEWTVAERYALERFYIGEGLCGNKLQAYPGFFNSAAPKFALYANMFPDSGEPNQHFPIDVFQAEVINFFEFKVKKEDSKSFGKPMGKILLEDPWGTQMTMTVFPKQWPEIKKRIKALLGSKAELEPGIAIYARGSLNWYEGDISIIFEDLLKCAPPPPLPKDLVPRKTAVKRGKEDPDVDLDRDEISEDIEDELVELGFADDDIDIDEESGKDGFNF